MFHAAQGLDWISRDRRIAADLLARAQVAERQGRHAEARALTAQAHQVQARLKRGLYRHEDRVDDAHRPPAMPPGVHPAARDPRMRGYMPAGERGWIPPWSPPPPRPLHRAPGPYAVVPPHRGYRRLPPGHTVQPRRVMTEAGVLRTRPFTPREKAELVHIDGEIHRWKRRRDWAQLHAPRRVIDAQAHLDKWLTRRAEIYRHAGQQHIFERGIAPVPPPRHAHMRARPGWAPPPRRAVARGPRSPWSVPARRPYGPARPIIIDGRSVAPEVDASIQMRMREEAIPGRGVRPESVRDDDGGADERATRPAGAEAHVEADAAVSPGFMGGWGKWLLLGALGVGIAAYANANKRGGGAGGSAQSARSRSDEYARTPLVA